MTHFIFDCDDVLLDWQTGFADFIKDMTTLTLDPAGPQSWCLADWIGNGCTIKEAAQWVREFNASQAFGNLKARPHARDVVWSLRDAGHTISVLTACGDSRAVKLARYWNLMEAFATDDLERSPFSHVTDRWGSGITTLPLGASKFDHLFKLPKGPDYVFVDDSFRHAQSGVVNGIRTYCLRCSHNRRDEIENPASGVIWIDSLLDLPIN